MPVRFLHLADLHLGAAFRNLGEREGERRQDLFDAFRRAVEFALEEGNRIDAVLVAGDVFDVHDPDNALVQQVKAQTRRLAEAGTPIFWIPGTHDRYDDPGSVYLHEDFPGVTLLADAAYGRPHEVTLNGASVAISGFAYHANVSPADPLADLPDLGADVLHVALFHGSVVDDGLDWTVKDHYIRVSPEAVRRAPVQYLAMGHYHNPREWPTARGAAYYPGTLEGRRFGENGERLLTVVELDAQWPAPRVETHPWNRRTLRDETLNVDLLASADAEDIAAWLRERATPDTLLRVRLRGAPEQRIAADTLQATVAGECFYLDVRDELAVFDSAWVTAFAAEESVRGEFVRRLRGRLDTAGEDERATLALALRLGVQAFAKHGNAAG